MAVNNGAARRSVTLSRHHYVNSGRIKAPGDSDPIYNWRSRRRRERKKKNKEKEEGGSDAVVGRSDPLVL